MRLLEVVSNYLSEGKFGKALDFLPFDKDRPITYNDHQLDYKLSLFVIFLSNRDILAG